MFRKSVRFLEIINEKTGQYLSWLTLAMVAVTFVVVVLRYVFDFGSIALQESANYMHAAVFMLGTAYAFKHGAHVRVDIFYNRLKPKYRALVDLLGNILFLLPVCGFIFFVSFEYVLASWEVKEASLETGGLPFVYVLKTVIPITALLLGIQAVADSLTQLNTLLSRRNKESGVGQ